MAWNGTVTNLGLQLLQQWMVSGATLTIDGAKTGEGTVPVAQLMGQSNVAGTAHTVGIAEYKMSEDKVSYDVQIQAEAQAYTAMQVGIFAHIGNGSSMLLALYQADPGSGISVYSSTDMPEFSTIFGADVEMSVEGDLDVTIDSSLLVSQGQMAAALALKLDAANVYNGLDKTAAGYALDARQGKVLGDAIAERNLKTYTSVTQLGLTAQSATILSAYNALPDGSALYAQSEDFANGATPSNGLVEIVKRQNARVYIAFYSKNAQTHDFRMYEGPSEYNGQSANAPTGNWVQMWDAQAPIPIDGGGTGASTAAAARTALDVYSKGETVPLTVPYNGNIDDIKTTSLVYLNNATGTTTGAIVSGGQFHGMLITIASSSTRAVQLHIPMWSTGAEMRYLNDNGWTGWLRLSKGPEQSRYVTIPYNLNAGENMHTNLKTIIDADLPSGYVFSGLAGFSSGNSNVVVIACYYVGNEWSFQLKNFANSNVTTDAQVHYICRPA